MVRAVGLYPAGSRFESWLPYHLTPTPAPLAVRELGLDDRADLFDQSELSVGRHGASRRQ